MNLHRRTLVLFTSDNGATRGKGRSNRPLRGNKGTTWEGGMREPCVVWWPGQIPGGSVSDALTSTLDVLPTLAFLAQAEVPGDRTIDGFNIWNILQDPSAAVSPREYFYYYQMDQLQAIRDGRWKLHLPLVAKVKNWGKPEKDAPMMLFDLASDVGESRNLAHTHPEIVERMLQEAQRIRPDLGDHGMRAAGRRASGWVEQPKLLRTLRR